MIYLEAGSGADVSVPDKMIKAVKKNISIPLIVGGGIRSKKEIEDAGCTGIEFQPIELSYNEWLMPGGEREKIYGKS